jgi:hypothetical protein
LRRDLAHPYQTWVREAHRNLQRPVGFVPPVRCSRPRTNTGRENPGGAMSASIAAAGGAGTGAVNVIMALR